MTQSAMADKSGRSLRWVNRVAVGDVDPLSDVRLLAENLGMPVDDFLHLASRYPDPAAVEKQVA